MKTEEIKELFTRFESIVCEYNGVECWSARELYPLLGYTQWRNFLPAIEKAKASCQNAGEDTAYHFADVRKMVRILYSLFKFGTTIFNFQPHEIGGKVGHLHRLLVKAVYINE